MPQATDLERENLEAHVDLCQQRYEQLERRLGILETKVDDLAQKIDTNQQAMIKTIVATTGTIIAGLLSTIVVVIQAL